MKILEEGSPATAVVTCAHCKCKMEYTNLDLRKDYRSNEYYTLCRDIFYIACPYCGEHIPVKKL